MKNEENMNEPTHFELASIMLENAIDNAYMAITLAYENDIEKDHPLGHVIREFYHGFWHKNGTVCFIGGPIAHSEEILLAAAAQARNILAICDKAEEEAKSPDEASDIAMKRDALMDSFIAYKDDLEYRKGPNGGVFLIGTDIHLF